jgi:sterol 3beta-glucosyltransferase
MKALLVTVGSRGDVQPFVALAARLRAQGHEPYLAAPGVYRDLAQPYDVPFLPLPLDMDAVGAAVAGKHGLRHVLAFARAMGKQAKNVLPVLDQLTQTGADVVVHHPVLPLGQHVAELTSAPAVVASPLPALVPTSEFFCPAWPVASSAAGRTANRASYRPARYLTGAWCRSDIDRWRRDHALPERTARHDPLGQPGTPVLHSFSRHVLPRPADWPYTAQVTGYWYLPAPESWTPPRRLSEFVEAGEPPVYIGFGSMPVDDERKLAKAIAETVKRTGVRVVVNSLSPVLRRQLSDVRAVFITRPVPHDWLLPRTSAVVHHGGAGTTGAAVRAGKPQVIWPFGIDQHFWARRMERLGVAVRSLPVRRLNAETLSALVDRATNDMLIGDLAIELGRRVRSEDGTGNAVAHLEQLTGKHAPAAETAVQAVLA